jgi:hypothetical protein
VHAAILPDGIDRYDMLMVERGRRPRFVVEALQVTRVHRGGERQHLQRHPPAQRELLSFIDNAHAAAADFAEQAEIAQRECQIESFARGRSERAAESGGAGVDQFEPGKTVGEGWAQVRVPGQEFLAVRPGAGFKERPVLLQGLCQPAVTG